MFAHFVLSLCILSQSSLCGCYEQLPSHASIVKRSCTTWDASVSSLPAIDSCFPSTVCVCVLCDLRVGFNLEDTPLIHAPVSSGKYVPNCYIHNIMATVVIRVCVISQLVVKLICDYH